jgi:sialate O-acetylesterase
VGAALRSGLAAAALAAVAIAGVSASRADAPVLDPPVGDGAVVQRDALVTVRGAARPHWPVVVVGGWGSGAVAVADADGRFTATLRTRRAGGPYRVLAWSGGLAVTRDVWVGEVWLCGGQSNMDFTVAESHLSDAVELPDASRPPLRLFTVAKTWADTPRPSCAGAWRAASPDAIGAFSAACWFFGRALATALRAPIGLIASTFPGSEIELWTSEKGLATVPAVAERLASIEQWQGDYEAAYTAWLGGLEQADLGLRGAWSRGADEDGWVAPGTLATAGDEPEPTVPPGVLWLRAEVAVPADLATSAARVEMHVPLEGDRAWVNGVERPLDHDAAGQRVYVVPAGGLRSPTTTVVVRRVTLGATAPPALDGARLHAGDQELAPASWGARIGLDLRHFRDAPRPPSQHYALLFDGMIAPLTTYPLRGIVWYQGEANVPRAAQYRQLFPALVRDWRAWWGRDLPFYFVQLPPYGGYRPPGAMAELREAQREALALPATGMVVTTDIADGSDIHSSDKRKVGRRLARWALRQTYGHADVVPSGPLVRDVHVDGARVRVEFDWAKRGLVATGDPLAGFTLAGSDHRFHPATARVDGSAVMLVSADVPAPVAVRFAWEDVPATTLVNQAGLPASPFRTDDWPGVTDGAVWDPNPAAHAPVAKVAP